jgi:hypothetical protein
MNDEDLDRRLRAADRMDGVRLPESVLEGVHREARAIADRSLRRRISAVAGIGVFSLGALTAAPSAVQAITHWLAVAEWQPDAGGEILPDSEMVDLSAPDLPEYIASLYPEWLPLAPGVTREQLVADVVGADLPEEGFTQEVGFRERFESLAYCGWVDAWLTADDPAVTSAAIAVMRDAIDWPAFTATDGGGRREYLTVYAMAAESGDRDGVQFAAWQYGCSAWDGTDRGWWIEQNPWFQQNDPRR